MINLILNILIQIFKIIRDSNSYRIIISNYTRKFLQIHVVWFFLKYISKTRLWYGMYFSSTVCMYTYLPYHACFWCFWKKITSEEGERNFYRQLCIFVLSFFSVVLKNSLKNIFSLFSIGTYWNIRNILKRFKL